MKPNLHGNRGTDATLAEVLSLHRQQTRDIPRRVTAALDMQRDAVARVEDLRGAPLAGCDVLEVGPGQARLFLMAIGLTNRAIGVEMAPRPARLGAAAPWRIWRRKDRSRLAKTLGRAVLGLERRTRSELARQLGVRADQLHARVVAGNAEALPFPDACFDAVLSSSVFEQLEHPDRAAAEVARVLRPGGVAHMITRLYTSHTGAHDAQLFTDPRARPPRAHLRAGTQARVQPCCDLNQWRLADYRRVFEDHWPGHGDMLVQEDYPPQTTLDALHAAGELQALGDEELRASALITTWRKPGGTILH